MTQVRKVALAARVFTLAALGALALILGVQVLRGVLLVVAVAMGGQALSFSRRLPESVVALLEGATIALVAAGTAPDNASVTPYLAIPALIGGMAGRVVGVWRVFLTEVVILVVGLWWFVPHLTRPIAGNAALWVITGLGLGFLGAALHRGLVETPTQATYRSALDLLKQLNALSERLVDGLDAVSVAEVVMADAAIALPMRQSALVVRSAGGVFTPLRFSAGSTPEGLAPADEHVAKAWKKRTDQVSGRMVAHPLRSGGEVVAVLLAECMHEPDEKDLAALDEAVAPQATKLYASLLFGQVRNAATSEERRRLAREVHDGVAQDVASLGYLVDSIAPASADQEEAVGMLRTEVTRVVSELRHSVFDLRNESAGSSGLGESISAYARHLGSHSPLTVHVTLDEEDSRLRPEVAAELLRIAQEAMNNARRHSQAENLWVTCRVAPPAAEVIVVDDGIGLQQPRSDSHGMSIMRERALRLGAHLSVGPAGPDGVGTRVHVRVDAASS